MFFATPVSALHREAADLFLRGKIRSVFMNTTPGRLTLLLPKIRAGLSAALGRFPWMLLCGLAGTVSAIVSTEREKDDDVTMRCLRLLMTVALGMPLFFSLRMLRERSAALLRWPVELIGLPLLAVWFFTLPAKPTDGPGIVWIRWLLLLAALHFFAAVSAYARGAEGAGFWQFNRRIFLRFCLATLYSAVLTGGLELALLSADKLFELKLEKSYAYLFFIMAGCFHPVFFLAGVPRDFGALDSDGEHPRGLKAFTQFALAPLVAVYTLILYAYAGKILLAREWPHGWVALPVLVLAGVGILAALLLNPLRERAEEKWAGWFCRWFPRAMGPLSLLLLLSVRERIAAYGVTEERYLGIVAGAWILVWSLVFIFKKRAGIRWIPASLAVICLLAAFGPWSAGAISKNSQLRRLEKLLEVQGLFANGKVSVSDKAVQLPSKDYEDIRSTIDYLAEQHGKETVQNFFVNTFKKIDWKDLPRWEWASELLGELKITNGNTDGSTTYSCNLDASAGVPIEGFSKEWLTQNFYDGEWKNDKRAVGPVFIGIDGGILKFALNEKAAPVPVLPADFVASLPDKQNNELPAEKLTVNWNVNETSYRFIFTNLNIRRGSDGKKTMQYCSFWLLEK
jgi:hypothetical protein